MSMLEIALYTGRVEEARSYLKRANQVGQSTKTIRDIEKNVAKAEKRLADIAIAYFSDAQNGLNDQNMEYAIEIGQYGDYHIYDAYAGFMRYIAGDGNEYFHTMDAIRDRNLEYYDETDDITAIEELKEF